MSTTEAPSPIDMSLVRIPACRVEPDSHYLLRLKGKHRWHRAYLDGNWWVGPFPVFHKSESGEIRQTPERVQGVIDMVAGRMAEPAPTKEELGIRQYYIERDLIDGCNELLCWPDYSDDGFSDQQLALFRAVLMAAAALQRPRLPARRWWSAIASPTRPATASSSGRCRTVCSSMRGSTSSIATVSAPRSLTGR